MKTKEELTALKEEVESLNRKLQELTDEELSQVSAGLILRASGNKQPIVNENTLR